MMRYQASLFIVLVAFDVTNIQHIKLALHSFIAFAKGKDKRWFFKIVFKMLTQSKPLFRFRNLLLVLGLLTVGVSMSRIISTFNAPAIRF